MQLLLSIGILVVPIHLTWAVSSRHGTQAPCITNRGVACMVKGDNQNQVINFVQLLSGRNDLTLIDTDRSCQLSINDRKHQRRTYVGTTEYDLECWDTPECMVYAKLSQMPPYLLNLAKDTTSIANRDPHVRTVYLPILAHNTASYTFLPTVARTSMFFITDTLTGCSVFVATPDNSNCNIVVTHTNYLCDDRSHDYNQQQEEEVLKLVHAPNPQCHYHIKRRWASSANRNNIIAGNYSYDVRYYDITHAQYVLYAYNLGCHARWVFCFKATHTNDADQCDQLH